MESLADARNCAGDLKAQIVNWPKGHLLHVSGAPNLTLMTRDEVAARKLDVHTTAGDHFAWLRTRLSLERTLMSWVRSATGLIGFGFTIVQVMERLQTQHQEKPVLLPDMPRNLGMALIGTGVIGLGIGIVQYFRFVSYLWSNEFKPIAGVTAKPVTTPLVAFAVLVEIVGIAALATLVFRLS